MSEENSAPSPRTASFEQQKKRAKELLRAFKRNDTRAIARVHKHRPNLRGSHPPRSTLTLADAQFVIARELGFKSWTALKRALDVSASPFWKAPPLHTAAGRGDLDEVNRLLGAGADPDARDDVDNATPLHFAANAGHLDVVKRLLDAGADVNAHGDDHEANVLGWATCLRGYHDAVARLLLAHGARHTFFTAIAMDDVEYVRRSLATDPALLTKPMSRNEHYRLPLHLAVFKNRPRMVELLLSHGANATATDATGVTAIGYVNEQTDPSIVSSLRAAGCELTLLAALRMQRFDLAEALLRDDPRRLGAEGHDVIALHLSTLDRNLRAVRWLIAHGVDVNAKRVLWDCNHTALHICTEHDIRDVARVLLDAGADPSIKDDKFQSDVLGWAQFLDRPEIARLMTERAR
jgi:ankyrin repeat protein